MLRCCDATRATRTALKFIQLSLGDGDGQDKHRDELYKQADPALDADTDRTESD